MSMKRCASGRRREGSPQFEALEARATLSTVPAGFAEAAVAAGPSRPSAMQSAPDDRLYAPERARTADRVGARHALALARTNTVESIAHTAAAMPAQSPSLTANEGQTVILTIAASAGSTYLWQHLVGASWVDVGTDSPDYTIPTVTTADAGEYRVSISSGPSIQASLPIDLTVNVGPVPRWSPGLAAEFFAFPTPPRAMPALAGRGVDATRTDPMIDELPTRHAWPGLDARFARNFAARETGLLEISTPGRYRFTLRSKDGSRLWVDGKPLVNNGGIHAMRGRSRSLTMTAGLHAIQVESFAASRGAGLILSWSGPGIPGQVVPADHLFHATATAGG